MHEYQVTAFMSEPKLRSCNQTGAGEFDYLSSLKNPNRHHARLRCVRTRTSGLRRNTVPPVMRVLTIISPTSCSTKVSSDDPMDGFIGVGSMLTQCTPRPAQMRISTL